MTDNDKIALVKLLSGESDTDTVSAFLAIAADTVLGRIYEAWTDMPSGATVPARYDRLQCTLAARYLARRGAEGEKVHNENGINRTWDSADDADILRRITPKGEVPQ